MSQEKAVKFALEKLGEIDPSFSVDEVFETSLHFIIKAVRAKGDPVCFKFGKESLETPGKAVTSIKAEIRILQTLDPEQSWAPKFLTAAEDNTWFVREWLPGKSLDQDQYRVWDRASLCRVWQIFHQAFENFHDRDDPILVRDIYPRNICVDGNRFYLFDFNSTKPLSTIHKLSTPSRFGTKFSRFHSPEHLRGDLSKLTKVSDYFGFGSTMYWLILGKIPWSNGESAFFASRRRYEREYVEACIQLSEAMAKLGFPPMDIGFLKACMNPDPPQRPQGFRPPY